MHTHERLDVKDAQLCAVLMKAANNAISGRCYQRRNLSARLRLCNAIVRTICRDIVAPRAIKSSGLRADICIRIARWVNVNDPRPAGARKQADGAGAGAREAREKMTREFAQGDRAENSLS